MPKERISTIFFLKSGKVRQYAVSTEGVELTIHLFSPFAFFPMIGAFGDMQNRYFYQAQTPCVLYAAPPSKVLAFLKENPDIHLDLTKRILHGIDKLSLRLERQTLMSARGKILSILLFLHRHFGSDAKESSIISEKITHEEIAAFAGLSRETVSRELEKLTQEGYITYRKRHIVIPSVKRLTALLKT